jgi:hypothetical protein
MYLLWPSPLDLLIIQGSCFSHQMSRLLLLMASQTRVPHVFLWMCKKCLLRTAVIHFFIIVNRQICLHCFFLMKGAFTIFTDEGDSDGSASWQDTEPSATSTDFLPVKQLGSSAAARSKARERGLSDCFLH